MGQFKFFNAGNIDREVHLIMANRDRFVDLGSNPSTGGLRGGFANTRPMVLYVGTAVAVVWDIVAFVHVFHFSLSGASVSFWWPWAWLLLTTIVLGWLNWRGRTTPWWAWALLGIGVFTVAATTEGTALSIWGALTLAVWPKHGHPWWSVLGGLAIIHAVIQWGLLLSVWHLPLLPTFINIDLMWATGLGMLISARGSNWHTAA